MATLNDDCRETGGLEHSLVLCKGARVMLTRNISVSGGLVNGAIGTISDFNYKDGSLSSIGCSFNTDKGIVNVPIQRDRSMIKVLPDCYVVRNQFPLSLAFAMTILNSQSLSLKTVFTVVGNSIFDAGQTYVALSRCKSLQG